MSGLLSPTEYQQTYSLDQETSETVTGSLEIENGLVSDPIASFLEKHGHEFTRDHDGELVTYHEAMGCSGLRMLVMTLGEGALGVTAATRIEVEDETKEDDEKEVTKSFENDASEQQQADERIAHNNSTEGDKQEVEVTKEVTQPAKQTAVANSTEQENSQPVYVQRVVEIPEVISDSVTTETRMGTPQQPRAEKINVTEIAPQPEPAVSVVENYTQTFKTTSPNVVSEAITTNEVIRPEVRAAAFTETVYAEVHEASKDTLMISETSEQQMVENTFFETPYTKREILTESSVKPTEYETPELEVKTSRAGKSSEETLENYLTEKGQHSTPSPQPEAIDLELEPLIKYDGGVAIEQEVDLRESWQLTEDVSTDEAMSAGFDEDFILDIKNIRPVSVRTLEYSDSSLESVPRLSLPVEQTEQAIHQLAQRVEVMDEEDVKTVHYLLDEIGIRVEGVQNSVKVLKNDYEPGLEDKVMEASIENKNEIITAEKVEQEIKALFMQLFEHARIEYDPKLIDSCLKLALKEGLPELILKTGQDEEENNSKDKGTHEVIRQLLVTISNIKKAVLHAYYIGKSALRLYSQLQMASKPV
ncbi:hypothetical protein H0X09_02320 [Candidatus Saccharibacteria bacterium]|nr:hypothetical protein [Candidatus Saccharibacteria bacterium]